MATPPDARRHPTAVFYGDSIVTGWRGTTAPRRRWSALVSAELGWREVDLAVDGMGWVRRRGPRDASGELGPSADDTTLLDAAIRLRPAVVVGCLGTNDLRLLPERALDVERSLRRDVGRLSTELPEAAVVWTMYLPFAELSPRAAWLEALLRAVCGEVGATYVAEFARTVNGDPALLCVDLTHPNDAGHAALAAALLPTLRAL